MNPHSRLRSVFLATVFASLTLLLMGIQACETDADGDGFPGGDTGTDCNDSDDTIYPGAVEICNGVDHDCDGVVCSSGCLDGSAEHFTNKQTFPTLSACDGVVAELDQNAGALCQSGWHRCRVEEFVAQHQASVPSGYRLTGGFGCQGPGEFGENCNDVQLQPLPFTGMCGNCGPSEQTWDVETNPSGCFDDVIYANASMSGPNLNTILQLSDNGECMDTHQPTVGELCCQ